MTSQGILLAGGLGTRLGPLTKATNKHLLPVYDKPLIYYSLSSMLLYGVKSLCLISSLEFQKSFKNLLGDGSRWGIRIEYAVQEKPEGIPQAFRIAEPFLNVSESIFLGLGDNILHGTGTGRSLNPQKVKSIAEIYCSRVSNPEDYGVAELDQLGKIISLEEKPSKPKSNLAITGFYYFPYEVIALSKNLKQSKRGEFEIVDLLRIFLSTDQLKLNLLTRGTAWLDAGSEDGLLASSEFVSALQKRQGLLVGSPDEAAWRMGYITKDQVKNNALEFKNSPYGQNLLELIKNDNFE